MISLILQVCLFIQGLQSNTPHEFHCCIEVVVILCCGSCSDVADVVVILCCGSCSDADVCWWIVRT